MSDMMKDCEATIGRLIDKQTTAFVSSVDPDGFPTRRQCFLRERESVFKHFILRQTHPPCGQHSIEKTRRHVFISVINAIFEVLC